MGLEVQEVCGGWDTSKGRWRELEKTRKVCRQTEMLSTEGSGGRRRGDTEGGWGGYWEGRKEGGKKDRS